ncbi:MAG TPA: hypothetical protein VES62_07370 [Thermoleophilaceae bacterium]|nr:hypothetical protein [Thermoleophilaceae bacterium]
MSEREFEQLVERLDAGELKPEEFTELVLAADKSPIVDRSEDDSARMREIWQTADLARSI